MGREIRCMAEIDDWVGDGRLLLETDELIFRGARKVIIPLGSISSARDDGGWLVIEHGDGHARFDLGRLTPSWVNAILHPRSRIDKLDVKAGSRVGLLGSIDADFIDELRTRTASVGEALGEQELDLIFVRVDRPEILEQLAPLSGRIKPAGGIWVLHPKGTPELGHEVISAAARAAGLVDTKSARFSGTLSALRLTIPRARRTGSR